MRKAEDKATGITVTEMAAAGPVVSKEFHPGVFFSAQRRMPGVGDVVTGDSRARVIVVGGKDDRIKSGSGILETSRLGHVGAVAAVDLKREKYPVFEKLALRFCCSARQSRQTGGA